MAETVISLDGEAEVVIFLKIARIFETQAEGGDEMNHVVEILESYKNEVDSIGNLDVEVFGDRLDSDPDLYFLIQH